MHELTASVASSVESASGFEQLEDHVFAVLCEFGCRETAAALRRRDDSLRTKVPSGWRVKDRRKRTVLTRFGPVEISRRRYIDEEGATRYALDEDLGLEKRVRVSPSLERLLVTLSSEVSFRDASGTVSAAVGAHVSHGTAHDRLGRIGRRLADEGRVAAADLVELGLDPGGTHPSPELSVEADGTVTSLQGASRRRGEVKLAVFYTDKAERVGAAHAGFQGARDFWEEAVAVAGSHYDLSTVRSCVVAGDGAKWVRGALELLPHSRFQLDPFHVRKALLRASRDHTFSLRVFSTLYADGLGAADGMLAAFAAGHPECAGDIDEVRGYLAANADGLWRAGCGTIEGHIDKILANRMKKRGRRWSPAGADAMAHVLAARRSRRPLPCGNWKTARPDRRPAESEHTALKKRSRAGVAGHVPQAHIVSHRTGESFTRKLRDIAGALRADC